MKHILKEVVLLRVLKMTMLYMSTVSFHVNSWKQYIISQVLKKKLGMSDKA